MPRISEAYADCAIYLYASERAAKEGQNAGGSGFLINVPASIPNMGHVYAVTNRHLVDGSDDGKFWTIRLTKKGGGIDCVTTQRDDWLLHEDGDDVAVLPIGIKDDVKWWSVTTTKFLDREGIEVYQIGYGDDIFLVGRLISQSGIEKNTPVARFGTLALPADPKQSGEVPPCVRASSVWQVRKVQEEAFQAYPPVIRFHRSVPGRRVRAGGPLTPLKVSLGVTPS